MGIWADQLKALWLPRSETQIKPTGDLPCPEIPAVSTGLTADLRKAWTKEPVSSSANPEVGSANETDSSPVFVDFETRSACNLKLGGRAYARHKSTQVVSLVAMIDHQIIVWTPKQKLESTDGLWPNELTPELPIRTFTGDAVPPPLLEAIKQGRPLCAHNATDFDAHIWNAAGMPPAPKWIDTLPLARAAGLPGKLNDLAKRMFGIGKQKDGKRLIRCINRRDKKGNFPTISQEQLQKLVSYNIQDVILQAGVFFQVRNCGEPEVITANEIINERGVTFDVELAKALLDLNVEAADRTAVAVETATDGEVLRKDLRRRDFLLEWLRESGLDLANLRKETLAKILAAGTASAPARAVIEARLAATRISSSKLKTAVEACGDDGRIRDLLVYHKAHTGRWAGRYVQPHNLPRPDQRLENIGALLPHVKSLKDFEDNLPVGVDVADGIAALIRPCFCAASGKVFCIADFAGIEARGVAWCAGETRQLGLFEQGGDNYCDLASEIFGYAVTPADKRERAVGKIAVLGCGYGMGAARFAATCQLHGVDLSTANTSPEAVVEAYRDRYSSIAGKKNSESGFRRGGLWKDVERAARRAISGYGSSQAGRCRFSRIGNDLVIELPSGRRIFYRNARLQVDNHDEFNGRSSTTITYDSPKMLGISTYGGELTEHIVSGICRDLLAGAILNCERQGLPVVLHVHDEIVLEVPEAQAQASLCCLLTIMSAPPVWAEGFPIEVEGFSAGRYFKSPPIGTPKLRARQGVII